MNKYNDRRLISYKKLLDVGKDLIKKDDKAFSTILNNFLKMIFVFFVLLSGTTANPKLAMISHKNLLNHAKSYLDVDL